MTDKLAKQKQVLEQLFEKVEYLQTYGISSLKFLCLPTEKYEEILNNCHQVFSSQDIPSKKILMTAMNDYEETQYMIMYDWNEHLINTDCLKVNDEYFVSLYSKGMEKAHDKISKKLESQKRGFCDATEGKVK